MTIYKNPATQTALLNHNNNNNTYKTMPDYIKRIQSRLSSKGLSMTRPQIIAELDIEVVEIQEADIPGIVENFLKNSDSSSIVTDSVTSQLLEIKQQAEQHQEHFEIVLDDSQKHQLVTSASQQLGITLVGKEVMEVSRSIASQFSDRRQMLTAITEAITAFTASIAEEEREILQEFFASAKGQLSTSNQNVKNTFNNLESEISQSNLDFKSVKADILSLFAVN